MRNNLIERKRFLIENANAFLVKYDKNENISDKEYMFLMDNDIDETTIHYLQQLVRADERLTDDLEKQINKELL
jgi:uncharacterized phage-like protein YoqJ